MLRFFIVRFLDFELEVEKVHLYEFMEINERTKE